MFSAWCGLLARYFGGDARSWLNLQMAYDLRVGEISHANRVAREVCPAATSPRDGREINPVEEGIFTT
jgi:plasmid maintenance system antidote protein VapI